MDKAIWIQASYMDYINEINQKIIMVSQLGYLKFRKVVAVSATTVKLDILHDQND